MEIYQAFLRGFGSIMGYVVGGFVLIAVPVGTVLAINERIDEWKNKSTKSAKRF